MVDLKHQLLISHFFRDHQSGSLQNFKNLNKTGNKLISVHWNEDMFSFKPKQSPETCSISCITKRYHPKCSDPNKPHQPNPKPPNGGQFPQFTIYQHRYLAHSHINLPARVNGSLNLRLIARHQFALTYANVEKATSNASISAPK